MGFVGFVAGCQGLPVALRDSLGILEVDCRVSGVLSLSWLRVFRGSQLSPGLWDALRILEIGCGFGMS